jgi:hypothetical protein
MFIIKQSMPLYAFGVHDRFVHVIPNHTANLWNGYEPRSVDMDKSPLFPAPSRGNPQQMVAKALSAKVVWWEIGVHILVLQN